MSDRWKASHPSKIDANRCRLFFSTARGASSEAVAANCSLEWNVVVDLFGKTPTAARVRRGRTSFHRRGFAERATARTARERGAIFAGAFAAAAAVEQGQFAA